MDWLEFIAAMTGSLAWPIVAALFAFLFRGAIRDALDSTGGRRLKRLKAGPLEAEWDDKVAEAIAEVAASPEADPPAPPAIVDRPALTGRLADVAQREPRAAVLAAYAEIEQALRRYLALTGFTEVAQRPMSARQLAQVGRQREALDPWLADAIDGATVLRNLAAHGPADELTPAKAADYLVLADAILYAIESKRARAG